MNIEQMNKSLEFLCDKYGVRTGKIIEENGDAIISIDENNETCPLLPWRVERRFFELKNMLADGTLEGPSTLRFASLTAGGCLTAQLEKEMDLATWMMESPIVSVYGACAADASANVIVKLANGMNVSVECSNKLPAGSKLTDRHEIIARRGVASDITVDTQVPQSSIYLFNDKGDSTYTDVDSELFGMTNDEIWTTRAAFAVLSDQSLVAQWKQAAVTMKACAKAVFQSDAEMRVVKF